MDIEKSGKEDQPYQMLALQINNYVFSNGKKIM